MDKFDKIANVATELNMTLLENEPMSRYTTFKIGGKCKLLVKIDSIENCIKIIEACKAEHAEYMVLGNGSNLLVSDSNINKVILVMGSDFSKTELLDDTHIVCQSGTLLSSLCNFAYQNSLSGLEFAFGIPATVGGAVFMNAGAYGGEISNVMESCKTLDLHGKVNTFTSADMQFNYRHSLIQENGNIILSATFNLRKAEKGQIYSAMNKNITARKTKQPLDFPSAGSMFKRPEGYYAAQLIEECGLKGLSIGGAQVSEKHSGFVINKGNATFNDVMDLVSEVTRIVKEKKGVILECEPRIIQE